MNTPAHVVASLLVLGRRGRPELAPAIVAGALTPDAPMFVFYLWQRVLAGTPEHVIWGSAYFEPGWQVFFDLANSLPLVALGAATAWALAAPRSLAFFGSMGIHCVFDLAVHREDAHRHFFPLSDFRFVSPVSYWDPRHYGDVFALLEIAFVVVGCAVLARRHGSRLARGLLGAILASYALYIGYAVMVWM